LFPRIYQDILTYATELSDTNYKIDFTVKRKEEGKDEDKECHIAVEITKVKNDEKHCVQVRKLPGSDMNLFVDTFKQIRSYIGGHANAEPPKL
jgi:hypothetical protein